MDLPTSIHEANRLLLERRACYQATLEVRPQDNDAVSASANEVNSTRPHSPAAAFHSLQNTPETRPETSPYLSCEMVNTLRHVEHIRANDGLQAVSAAAFEPPPLAGVAQEHNANPDRVEQPHPPTPESAQESPAPTSAPRIPTHVKTFVELNLAALQAKKDGLLRLYYVLRAHDPSGQGWVSEETARGVTSFMYTWSGARYWLRKGDRSWWVWDKPAGRIILRKPAYVAAALGVSQVLRRPVAIPLADMATEAGASAALYATLHTERQTEAEDRARRIVVNAMLRGKAAAIPYEANPISKQVLSEMTGLHRSTLTRYDKLARLKKKTNFVTFHLSDTRANRDSLAARGIAGVFRYRQVIKRRGRKPTYDNLLAARLPDTFDPAPGQASLKRNNHKRINRSIGDHLASRMGTDHQVTQGANDMTKRTRFYYDSAQKLEQAAKRDGTRDRFWRKRRERGRVWWQAYESTQHDEIARLDPQERAWVVLNQSIRGLL